MCRSQRLLSTQNGAPFLAQLKAESLIAEPTGLSEESPRVGNGRSWSLLGHFDPTTGGANQEETIRERYKCVKSDVLVPEARKAASRAWLCYPFMVTKHTLFAQ